MSEDRAEGIPAKVTLITSERATLVNSIKCYYETDYMWRLGKVGLLRQAKENIDVTRYKATNKDTKARDLYSIAHGDTMAVHFRGYGFF